MVRGAPTHPTEEFITNALNNPEITWEQVKTGLRSHSLKDTVKALIARLTDTNLAKAQAILTASYSTTTSTDFKTKTAEYIRDAKSAFFHEVRFSRSANEETRIEFLGTAIYLGLRSHVEAVDREFAKHFSTPRPASRSTEAAGGAGVSPDEHIPALATTMRAIASSSEGSSAGSHSSTSFEGL